MNEKPGWLPHGFRLATSVFQTQAALGWGVIVALVALVGVIYLTIGSDTIISGYRIQQLTWELKELQVQNTILEAKIAERQSIDRLRTRALELGFVSAQPENIEYLLVSNYPSKPMDSILKTQSNNNQSNQIQWWNLVTEPLAGWSSAVSGDSR
ncbi:MAG: hypothetical protein ABFQ89_01175 [Chloroflexota bacterium]